LIICSADTKMEKRYIESCDAFNPQVPELSRTPKDGRPHTIDELENCFARSGETADGRGGRPLSRIMDTREVRDGGGAKREDGLPLAAAD